MQQSSCFPDFSFLQVLKHLQAVKVSSEKILLACLNTALKNDNTSIFLWKGLLYTSVISWLFCFESTGVVWILNTMLTLCGHRHKTEGKEQCRRWVCSKPVFEQEQNVKQATAKQATESSPAERAELKTLAGTTEAALSMWPELKTTYGAFRNSGDSCKKRVILEYLGEQQMQFEMCL